MRPLTRQITRRIADLVVTIAEEGIKLRKFRARGNRSAKTISWTDLRALTGAGSQPNRTAAFRFVPLPGWCPKPGEHVYLHTKYKYARGIVVHIHPAVPESFITVDLKAGNSRLVKLSELRPAPAQVPKKTGGQKDLVPIE